MWQRMSALLHISLFVPCRYDWPMTNTQSVLRYRIRNWHQYNRALINRGRLTVWFDERAVAARNQRRGREHQGRIPISPLNAPSSSKPSITSAALPPTEAARLAAEATRRTLQMARDRAR